MAQRWIIEVEGLTKRFGERTAVDGISFRIAEGEIFGLLGPNGAGKTTTISMLTTLVPPDAGRALIAGQDVVHAAQRVKPLIGYVPQDLALYPTLSAWDNLAFFGRVYGLHGRELRRRVDATLDLVGLRDRATEPVQTYSGGMKRRLNIAAALLHQPRVLFLDEPTVGVDPQSRHFIFEHILRLKAQGMTILYTTHYMEEAQRLCDRVAIMDEGRIVALDSPAGLLELLGGGIIHLGVAPDLLTWLAPAVEALLHVRTASVQEDRIVLETTVVRLALLELLQLCNERDVAILSLEVLEPSLESVFLHLTGKRLRD